MKKKNLLLLIAAVMVVTASFIGCLKDNGTATYKVYTPVIKDLASIRQQVKTSAPQTINTNGKMSVLGSYIYLAEPNKGIHVINNKNTAAPVNESFITIPGCSDMAIVGNILYADCYSDLLAIDLSTPSAIKIVKVIANNFPDKRTVYGYTVDSTLAIVDWTVKDSMVSVQPQQGQGYWQNGSYYTTSNSPTYIATLSSPTLTNITSNISTQGSEARFAIQNKHLFTVSNYSLTSIDISVPANPTVLSTQYIGDNIETIYPFKDKLFIGSQAGVSIFDVSTPTNPVYISGFSHATFCDPVIADNNTAYITLRSSGNHDVVCGYSPNSEMDVLDVTDLTQVKQIGTYNLTNPYGLSKDGNTLLVCDGTAGIRVYNAADPTNLVLVQTLTMAETYDVVCNNGIALVSAKDGLYQYDYTNPASLKLISKLSAE